MNDGTFTSDGQSLPLRDKAAQLVFARLGSNMPPPVTVEEDEERVEALLERCPLGGLVLFNGTRAHTPRMLARLQAHSRYPLLIGSDMERGAGQQVRGATVFPHAMAYAAAGAEGPSLLEATARATAREALACGIHITFAPVADVNRNPANPIIATRAFGTEPEQAARLVEAYIRGCRAEGLLTTAKHFPGHGNTSEDSHATLPRVTGTRDELDRTDLVPFRAAVGAGVDLVMTAHVAYPALDPQERPATLSPPILQDLLRHNLGFTGPVITDSLLMGAMRSTHADVGEQAVSLLQAGVDILLDTPDPEGVVDGLVQAVEAGRLEEAVLDRALARLWGLKQRIRDRFGPSFFRDPGSRIGLEEVGAAAHQELAREVARRAVKLLKADAGAVPIEQEASRGEGLLVVLIEPHRSRLDQPEAPLGQAVRSAFPGAQYLQIGPEPDEARYAALQGQASRARRVVVALVVKPAAWRAYGLLPAQEQLVRELIARQPVVLAALGSPHILAHFPGAAAHLCTYSDVAASQSALVDVLSGSYQPAVG